MNLPAAIERRLGDGPATVEEISETVGHSAGVVRNALARMYFVEGTVGTDPRRRYHLLTGPGMSNGVPVIRHRDGVDVYA